MDNGEITMSEDDLHDWNAIAPAYASRMEGEGDRCFPEIRERFWEMVGDVRGKRVLDLGCGQGWLTNTLSERGASVIGVDGSAALIARARTLFPRGNFEIADLAVGLPDLGGPFDLVVSHMVVMDIPEIDVLFGCVAKTLRAGGQFVFTLPHPCFFMHKSQQDESGGWYRKVTGYLDPETRRIDSFGGHNHYHRPLSHYFRALSNAGLAVDEFYEPVQQARSDRIDPAFLRKFPVFLMMGARKIEGLAPLGQRLPAVRD